MNIISRAEARAKGLNYYFTGKPCSRGHIVHRHLTGTCSACQQVANRAWSTRNPGEGARRSAEWQKRNPERAREKSLRSWRKSAGIPAPEYDCPENCELCSRKLIPGRTHLDHDHVTGKFRGWLCNRCNRGLGYFDDNIAGLKLAVAYLERTGSS